MESFVMYDKKHHTLNTNQHGMIPKVCETCITKKRSVDYYTSIINKEGLHYCPYGFATYVKLGQVFTSIISRKKIDQVEYNLRKYNQKLEQFTIFSKNQLLTIIYEIDDIRMENIEFRDAIHDLRNIASYFNSMCEKFELNHPKMVKKDKDAMSLISLYELINYRLDQLNDFAPQTNMVKIQKLHPMFKKAGVLLSHQAKRKNIQIYLSPLQDNHFELPNRIYITIFNLLENAIKHSKPNKFVSINFEENHSTTIVTIANIGSLIEDDEKELLFKRNYRGKNTTTKGSGLGLSLAKEILEENNIEFKLEINDYSERESVYCIKLIFNNALRPAKNEKR